MKRTIILASLINVIVVTGLSAMWRERVQDIPHIPRAQTSQVPGQSRRQPITPQERQRARLREKKDTINAYHRMSRYAGAPESSVMEAATRPVVETDIMPTLDERVIALRMPALSDDEMMQLERKRQSDLKLLSGMHPETVSGVKKAMRKRPDISILESPGRRFEYSVAREREAAKNDGQGQFAFDYDSPEMLKRYDRLAYEKLEPNAPVIQSWAGRTGRPFHEQFLYTLPEYVTPEMAEAYEQMKPSTVYNSLPRRSWADYWKEESGLASDIYAAKRRGGEFVKPYWEPMRNLFRKPIRSYIPNLGISRRISDIGMYFPSRRNLYHALTVPGATLGERMEEIYDLFANAREDNEFERKVAEEIELEKAQINQNE